jgi:hypothetical protein
MPVLPPPCRFSRHRTGHGYERRASPGLPPHTPRPPCCLAGAPPPSFLQRPPPRPRMSPLHRHRGQRPPPRLDLKENEGKERRTENKKELESERYSATMQCINYMVGPSHMQWGRLSTGGSATQTHSLFGSLDPAAGLEPASSSRPMQPQHWMAEFQPIQIRIQKSIGTTVFLAPKHSTPYNYLHSSQV